MQRAMYLVFLLTLTSIPAFAQGLPGTQIQLDVTVVSIVRNGDTSQVNYLLNNRATSLERLFALTIETPTDPLHASNPLPSQSWNTSLRYGDRPVVRWAALNDSILRPGTGSQILSFSSRGLPGVVDAHVEGYYDLPETSEDDPEAQTTIDPLVANSVPVRVVGFELLPDDATPESLTARLDSLTGEVCTLGWITQASLCTTLRGHLTAQPARLTAFRSDVAASHTPGGPVTDNAYWLLKVNADYILSLTPTRPSTLHPPTHLGHT